METEETDVLAHQDVAAAHTRGETSDPATTTVVVETEETDARDRDPTLVTTEDPRRLERADASSARRRVTDELTALRMAATEEAAETTAEEMTVPADATRQADRAPPRNAATEEKGDTEILVPLPNAVEAEASLAHLPAVTTEAPAADPPAINERCCTNQPTSQRFRPPSLQ